MPTETSAKAYREIIEEGLLGEQQAKLFQAIHDYPGLNDREYSQLTGLERGSVCGRRNELMALGIVLEAGIKEDLITGRSTMTYKVSGN